MLPLLTAGLFLLNLQFAAADEPTVPKRALLVGVAKYAHLPSGEQLRGCANDVAVMRRLLQERYGFQDADIATLVDEQATGAALRAELKALADWVQQLPPTGPPAVVVFHFSGHGAQLPDQPSGTERDEDDGLDETLVPHDASRQGGTEDIRDDELYAFAQQLCANQRAKLWIVLDCCHSGTGARGATRVRKLERKLSAVSPPAAGAAPIVETQLPPGAVVLSACRAREVEPEYDATDGSYGLLTRFLVQALQSEPKVSELSVALLREAILDRYRRDPAVSLPPMPQLEGSAADLQGTWLGASARDRPAYWAVSPAEDDRAFAVLQAGSLHGVTRGSQFQLYEDAAAIVWESSSDPRRQRGQSGLWLQVTEIDGATARGRVFRWYDGDSEDDELPRGFRAGYAVERYHDHGGFELRLRIVQSLDATTDGPALALDSPATPAAIRQLLTRTHGPQESEWCRVVTCDEPCDLLLRIAGNMAALFPATGMATVDVRATRSTTVPAALRGGWGPIALDATDAPQQLADYLRRIARARNLLRIAQTGAGRQGSSGSAAALPIQLELVRVDQYDPQTFAIQSSSPWPQADEGGAAAGGDRIMHDGDLFAYRVTNTAPEGSPPVYITVLQIDADMGIDQVLPWQQGTTVHARQYLEPGKSVLTDPFQCNGDPQLPPVYGRRQALVLATLTENHFYMLAQDSLPRARSATAMPRIAPFDSADAAPTDTLERLLLEGVFFQASSSRTRSLDRSSACSAWGAATVDWMVTSER